MTRYEVELTEKARAAIVAEARYIAVEAMSPRNAQRWLEMIWDAVDSLERWPRGGAVATESDFVAYEVRQLVVGSHLLLFSCDEELRKVWVLGIRHGHRLPRSTALPADPRPDSDGS